MLLLKKKNLKRNFFKKDNLLHTGGKQVRNQTEATGCCGQCEVPAMSLNLLNHFALEVPPTGSPLRVRPAAGREAWSTALTRPQAGAAAQSPAQPGSAQRLWG